MRKVLAVLACLGLGAVAPGAAQSPAIKSPASFAGVTGANKHNKLFQEVPNRYVTVGPDYLASFPTIKAACDYVATQSPSQWSAWRIKAYPYPGTNSLNAYAIDAAVTIPAYTTLEGEAPGRRSGLSSVYGTGLVVVAPATTFTAGTLFTLADGAGAMNLLVDVTGITASGNLVVFDKAAGTGTASLSNVTILVASGVSDTYNTDLMSVETGGLALSDVLAVRSGTATKTRHLVASGAATVYGKDLHFTPGASQATLVTNLGTGTMLLRDAKLDAGATTDLTKGSSGAVQVLSSFYTTTSGAITRLDAATATVPGAVQLAGDFAGSGSTAAAPVITATHKHTAATSAPATCAVGEVWIDTTGAAEKVCACTATNTWKCAALS